MDFALMNEYNVEINTAPGAPDPAVYAALKAGITGFEPSNNEETDQTPYMDGNGFGTTTVTGAQVTYSVSGHRKYGDAAQDYIYGAGVQYGLGNARETQARITDPEGNLVEGDITLVNIEGPSGEANAKGEISFEIHFNGKPTFTAAAEVVDPPA